MKRTTVFFVFFLLNLIPNEIFAATPQKTWTTFVSPGNVINYAVRGDEMWWAMEGGAVRWSIQDKTYKRFLKEDGLPSNLTEVVDIAPNGDVWISAEGKVFPGFCNVPCRFDGKTWTSYTNLSRRMLPRTFLFSSDGTVWVDTEFLPGITMGAGLFSFDGKEWVEHFKDYYGLFGVQGGNYTYSGYVVNSGYGIYKDGSFWAGVNIGIGQYKNGAWKIFTDKDGLPAFNPQSQDYLYVTNLYFAPDAKIWAAFAGRKLGGAFDTRGYASKGLSCYDGTSWKTYNVIDGLPSDKVLSMGGLPDGRLWCTTSQGPVLFKDGEWVSTTDSLLAVAPNGVVWVRTPGGLARYEGDKMATFSNGNGLPDAPYTISSLGFGQGNIVCMRSYRDNRTFFVSYFNGSSWSTALDQEGFVEQSTFSLAQPKISSDGIAWFYTHVKDGDGWRYGVSRYDGKSVQTDVRDGSIFFIESPEKTDAEGAVWFNSWDYVRNGKSRYKNGTWTHYFMENALSGNVISTVMFASDGAVWFNTNRGLSRFNGNTWQNYSQFHSLYFKVDEIVGGRDGKVWIRSEKVGVLRYENGIFTPFWKKGELLDSNISSLVVDPAGTVWISYQSSGLARYDGKQWIHFNKGNGLPDDIISTLSLDTNGIAWIVSKSGVSRFKDGIWTTFPEPDKLTVSKYPQMVVCPNNTVWLRAYGNGVYWYDGKKWTLFNTTNGLPSNNVRSIQNDSESAAWVTTDMGISRFDGKEWITYTNPCHSCLTRGVKYGL